MHHIIDNLIGVLRHPNVLAVSVQLLILYCVAVVIFFGVDSGNRSASASMKDDKALGKAVLFGLTVVSNALGVWTFVFISKRLNTVPRLTMIGLPLLLILEKHAQALWSNREQRGLELLRAAGMIIGTVGAAFMLMHGYPIK